MKKIKLTKDQYALVDNADFELLNKFTWHAKPASNTFYAVRTIRYGIRSENKKHHIKMHQVLIKYSKGMEIDHKDGNGLNNQRKNLRIATHSQNGMNKRTPNKGVSWHKASGKWRARIKVNGQEIYLGIYDDKNKALKIYNKAAKIYHGEYAVLHKI